MKKTFRYIGMLLMVLVAVTGVASCSNDDDDDKYNPEEFTHKDPALIGTWVYDVSTAVYKDTETIVFNSDGTFTETDEETERGTVVTSFKKGTWSTNAAKNQLRTVISDSSERGDIGDVDVDYYSIKSDGTLILDDHAYTPVTTQK